MEEIRLKSTSRVSAVTDDRILRQTKTTRLIFRPILIDNIHDSNASVKGTFIFQRKKNTEEWEDINDFPLSKLKSDEWVKLELKTQETLDLYNELNKLYSLFKVSGIPSGEKTFIEVDKGLDALTAASQEDVTDRLNEKPQEALILMKRVIKWISNNENPAGVIEKLETLNPGDLQQLNSLSGLSTLKAGYSKLRANEKNSSEEFWQTIFTESSFILSQIFSYPIIIVKGKAYVGGKTIENADGNVVDFLVKNSVSNNSILIEIKTPTTNLLNKSEYRNGIFSPSKDLSGAIVQTMNYKQSLLSNYQNLASEDTKTKFEVFNPACVLIVGNQIEEFDNNFDKKKSFQLFRSSMKEVEIVTFDEIFEKIKLMIDLIEGKGK